MLILGILVPALGAGPPLAAPELQPAAPAVQTLINVGIVLATVSSFVMCALVLYGLRTRERV